MDKVVLVQCPQEIQIQTDTVVWWRCDLEYKHSGVCQTAIYQAKHHDGRNVRAYPMLIQWSPLELDTEVPEVSDVPQCDFRAPARWMHAEDVADWIVCEEPAYFECRVINNATQAVNVFKRCTQHGEALRNIIRDNNGLTRSGKVRILSVEAINAETS